MGQDDQQPLNAETDDWVFSSGISLGALLKKEREKKGLSHTQISQQIRLRPRFLEAIENEEWDLLPAPTFVRGFIRSYARVLGLDEERVVDLYGEEAEADDLSQEFVLPSIPQRKKWPFMVVGLLFLLAAAAAFYAWFSISTDSKETAGATAVSVQSLPVSEKPIAPDEQQKTEKGPLIEESALSTADSELTAGVSAVSSETQEEPKTPENALSKPAVTRSAAEEKPEVKIPSAAGEAEVLNLQLKGHITERTWVRISIDGLKSKEYVFGPSDTPEWKAEKGFELLIGNAGGIVLEFNGKKMDNLGKQGQVVRIKLPEDEERSPARD
ncbi:MAG: helix-turn-helix domain-containing protein [Deltaproteobacteria bacterium]|nr:helix-turn-helix domain-containing protein [Deltaproteobacteria bacterium]